MQCVCVRTDFCVQTVSFTNHHFSLLHWHLFFCIKVAYANQRNELITWLLCESDCVVFAASLAEYSIQHTYTHTHATSRTMAIA